jgi:hypothetical protein
MTKRKVFISHSWEDNEISRKLAEYLKRDGADIWIDYSKIHGGDSLPRRISEALEWCDTLILLWSKSAKDSYYVNLEWENALDLRKIIIPCLLDETKRPAILRRCLFIDFKNFDVGYSQLAYAFDLVMQPEVIKKVAPPVIEKLKKESETPVVPPPIQRVLKPKILFRSKAKTLSADDVKSMLKKFDFFDSSWNKAGRGFDNQYKAETIKGDKVILDEASGLMWQQGGSPESMSYEAAKKWVEDLNNNGYAGYHDWRLPTLEEAMSLMEPRKNKDLYIDPIFDSNQTWIWTSDPYQGAAGRQWVVNFSTGYCNDLSALYYYLVYVRAVCFGQSSP